MVNVIVIDDDPLEGEAIEFLLKRERPHIKMIGQAFSGLKGVDLVKKSKPDIAFVDIQMPGLNGIATTKILKQVYPNLKVIMISAYDYPEYIQNAYQMGACNYLLKPVHPKEFISVMDGLCIDLTTIPMQNRIDEEQQKEDPTYIQLSQQLLAGDIQASHELIKSFLNDLFKKEDPALVRTQSMKMVNSLLQDTGKRFSNSEAIKLLYNTFAKGLEAAHSLNEIENCFRVFIESTLLLLHPNLYDPGYEIVSQAKSIIQSHFDKDITLENVAQRIHISPFYLSRLFKEKAGINFKDYLIEVRLEKAKFLLLTTNDTIDFIAREIGYSGGNYFSRLFTKQFNIKPSEYRSLHQKRSTIINK
ncbi:MAG: response regulator transcription factor [Dehalobacterium sp.]|jgi:two-component system response regulator YesN